MQQCDMYVPNRERQNRQKTGVVSSPGTRFACNVVDRACLGGRVTQVIIGLAIPWWSHSECRAAPRSRKQCSWAWMRQSWWMQPHSTQTTPLHGFNVLGTNFVEPWVSVATLPTSARLSFLRYWARQVHVILAGLILDDGQHNACW